MMNRLLNEVALARPTEWPMIASCPRETRFRSPCGELWLGASIACFDSTGWSCARGPGVSAPSSSRTTSARCFSSSTRTATSGNCLAEVSTRVKTRGCAPARAAGGAQHRRRLAYRCPWDVRERARVQARHSDCLRGCSNVWRRAPSCRNRGGGNLRLERLASASVSSHRAKNRRVLGISGQDIQMVSKRRRRTVAPGHLPITLQ